MCVGTVESGDRDAAYDLAVIVYGTGAPSAYGVKAIRKVIREDWKAICQLAHKIHDEETNTEATIIRVVADLGYSPGSVLPVLKAIAVAGLEIRKKEVKK